MLLTIVCARYEFPLAGVLPILISELADLDSNAILVRLGGNAALWGGRAVAS